MNRRLKQETGVIAFVIVVSTVLFVGALVVCNQSENNLYSFKNTSFGDTQKI